MPKKIKKLPESLKNALSERLDDVAAQELDLLIAEYGKEEFHRFYTRLTLSYLDDAKLKCNGHLLYVTCHFNLSLFVEKLLFYDISPNEKSSDGSTPLMITSALGYEKIVRTLLKYQADLLAVNQQNATVLMWTKSENILTLLLQQAKDTGCLEKLLSIKNKNDKSAFEMALDYAKLPIFLKLIEIENWEKYANLHHLLHIARTKSFNKPDSFKDYNDLCLMIRKKISYVGHRPLIFPDRAFSISTTDCYTKLFGRQYNAVFDSSREEALKYVMAQIYSLLHTPQKTFKYLRFLNRELIRYFKEIHDAPFPELDESTYTFKVIDGIVYPIPNDNFDINIEKHQALQNVLFALLKKQGLAKEAFKWIGFIDEKVGDEMAKNGYFFKESSFGGLFHGTLSHMLQLAIIIYAIQRGKINLKLMINGELEEISIEEILSAFINLKEYGKNNKLWLAILDRRHFSDITFVDPYRLISIIMSVGKKYGLTELSNSLIHSFCKGYLKSLRAYHVIIPALKDSPHEFAEKINELMSPTFDPPKQLINYAIEKQEEKNPLPGAIIKKGEYAAFPLQYSNYLYFKPKNYKNNKNKFPESNLNQMKVII